MSKTLTFSVLTAAVLGLSGCDQLGLGGKTPEQNTTPAPVQQEQPAPPQSGEGLVRPASTPAPAQQAITSIQSKPYGDPKQALWRRHHRASFQSARGRPNPHHRVHL